MASYGHFKLQVPMDGLMLEATKYLCGYKVGKTKLKY
jgi:hypothetical protein